MKKMRKENLSNKLTKTNLQNFITCGAPGRGHAVQRQKLKSLRFNKGCGS